MKLRIRANGFFGNCDRFLTCAFILDGFLFCLLSASAQSPPNYPTNIALQSWSFYNPTTWQDDAGYAPVSFTNISESSIGYGPTLVVDTNIPAWLKYNVVENDGTTNLTLNFGTTTFWFAPESWSSTNAGGVGPGEYGRLLEIGNYSANSSYGLWSIYVDSGGNNLYFSAQTNDLSSNLTTYVCAPISWTTNYFHFVALSYSSTNTTLYLDGVQVTNGPGVTVYPGPNVLTNGFCIGSDTNGIYQAHGLFDLVQTYNYPLDSNDVQTLFSYYYSDFMIDPENIGYMDDFNLDYFSISTTTNLAISPLSISNNTASLFVVNSAADVLYEIQGCTNLSQRNWFTEAFVDGSELTNWTWANFYVSKQGDLFLRIRNWQDTTGTGIPDWWWLEYFGQTTNVNAYASDPPGDGYTDLQKYQMGLNPTNYYNPNPPPGFFGCLDTTGTNVVLEWSNAPGPVVSYTIQKGILSTNTGNYVYSQYLVNSNATFFVDTGAISNANAWNNTYSLAAVYPGNSFSGTDTWSATYAEYGYSGQPYGAPLPNNGYAFLDATGTNVFISWTPPTGGAPTNYIVIRATFDFNANAYDYSQIASLAANVTYFEDVRNTNSGNDFYEVEAIYSGKGVSQPVTLYISSTPPMPTGFSATVSTNGTNVSLSWTPPQGITITNYIIERGVWNTNTDSYNYTQIGEVGGGTNSFLDIGAIAANTTYNINYQIEAVDSLGQPSYLDNAYLSSPPPPPPQYANLYVTANLVRNGTGRWQVMFSAIPTNISTIQLTWNGDGDTTQQNISTSALTNGIYQIPDTESVNLLGYSLTAQLLNATGTPGQPCQAGTLSADAPYFVDGRRHLKQNLEFVIRAAALNLPFAGTYEDYNDNNQFDDSGYSDRLNQSGTNFEEFSFIYHGTALDNLWPFAANYYLDNFLVNTSRTNDAQFPIGTTDFTFTPNFATNIPAPPLLTNASPYWIIQPGFNIQNDPQYNPYTYAAETNWGITVSGNFLTATLQSGLHNMFGLTYENGSEADLRSSGDNDPFTGTPIWQAIYQTLPVGGSVTVKITNSDYSIGTYASQCLAPTLTLTNYYFAPLLNPENDPMSLPEVSQQPIPTPIDDTFNITNQTPPVIIGAVGQSMIVGGWAKYLVQGSANKYAYLGQYFETNCFLLNGSGVPTTTNAGILSPYGEFFPFQAGQAELVTMPDIDSPYGQGTGAVDVISLNVDANHDGTMNLTYGGPDFVSASNPFRFWVNDVSDSGDYGGDGIPGQGALGDGVQQIQIQDTSVPYLNFKSVWQINGRRDLVNYFPVYLNIWSLFQSNALSAGISATDTNYQFVLSQSDGALRFAYTDLKPTNYMNFLRDTNESSLLEGAPLTTITATGVALTNAFLSAIATNNQGVILLEAWTNTTQPLVLTIYHSTNQIVQTLLPLSISGVEQMFRSKSILLNPDPRAKADRLTDASVPNEPNTTDMNFVFVHGYNVNPDQARGWNADYYKRLYWSGSHAKFYGVTWEASDTQGQILDGLTFDLQTNIVNAFITAPQLNTFLNSLSGTNVVAAHSLGNMLVLSTLNDCTNQNINTYFMIDAAVAIEAIDSSAPLNPDMYVPAWTNYESSLWASEWHNLFPTNDSRSKLTWNSRLKNFQNAAIYNLYSSGEDVLRDDPGAPPSGLVSAVFSQIVDTAEGAQGVDAWAWEEKCKGQMIANNIISSDHGGWRFNDTAYGTNIDGGSTPVHMSPTAAAELTVTQLQATPFFDFSSAQGIDPDEPFTADTNLLGAAGSTYAQANQNRILSDAIPCLTLPLGANYDTNLDLEFGDTRNFDMQANFENGWPQGRPALQAGQPAAGEWHHSDNRAVAYTFTYKLFNQLVSLGNLK